MDAPPRRCPCIAHNHDHKPGRCPRALEAGYTSACRTCHYYRADHVPQRDQR